MTRTNLLSKIQFLALAVVANFTIVLIKAQEKTPDLKVDVNVNKGESMMSGDLMSNPLVWIIGALVLILMIALVARGGGNK